MRGGVAIRRSSSGADNGPAGAGTPQAGSSQAAQVDLSGFAELKAILRIRPFRRLWAVLGLSSLGDWLGLLATSTFAADHVSGSTAKGAAFGTVIAVRLLPALLLGPGAGGLAGRVDRRATPGAFAPLPVARVSPLPR